MARSFALSTHEQTAPRRIPIAVLILVAGLIVAIIGLMLNRPVLQEPGLLDEDISLAFGPANYAQAVRNIDERLELAQERVARSSDQWAYQEGVAINSLIRAQLTGSANDFGTASNAIAEAMQLAPGGAGPAMTDAVINLSLHRYPAARRDLDIIARYPVPLTDGEAAEIKAIQGDIAFYNGDYTGARAVYEQAELLDGGAQTLFRLATWYKYNGQFDEAIALYQRGAANKAQRTPQMLAVYLLQIGALELQRGNWDLAQRYFARADAVFPGYWLAEAHLAQMLAVANKTAQAEKLYLAILAKTENPDVMMALATLYQHTGDSRKASAWSRRAGAILNDRVKMLPQAYYDHALDYAILEEDAPRALMLARQNYRARAYGDSIIGLARAYMMNNQPQRAVALLKKVGRSGWISTEQHLALAHAYEQLGETRLAQSEQRAALKLNPKALDPNIGMLAFGNH